MSLAFSRGIGAPRRPDMPVEREENAIDEPPMVVLVLRIVDKVLIESLVCGLLSAFMSLRRLGSKGVSLALRGESVCDR